MKQGLIVFVPSMALMDELTVAEIEKLQQGLSKVYSTPYLDFSILVLWPFDKESLTLSQRLMFHEAVDKIENGYYDEFEIVGDNRGHPLLAEFFESANENDIEYAPTTEKTELQRILYA